MEKDKLQVLAVDEETGKSDTANDRPRVKTELMDLPEPVLINIMSYLGHNFLRHTAARVSTEFKRLAHSRSLWSTATLEFLSHDCCESQIQIAEKFIRDLLVTPHLHHLVVGLSQQIRPNIMLALLNTRCKIYKLTLQVEVYSTEILLFLVRHPELRKLELEDEAIDDTYSASVAAAVGALVPRLISLNLSHSRLINMHATGLLLSKFSKEQAPSTDSTLVPSADSIYYPAGSEPEPYVDSMPLDLEEDCEFDNEDDNKQVHGLQRLKFEPFGSIPCDDHPDKDYAIIQTNKARNLAALMLANKHSLRKVLVDLPNREVYLALAECLVLQCLSVSCDPTGEGVCAMLEALRARMDATNPSTTRPPRQALQNVRLVVHGNVGPECVSSILESLGQNAPRIHLLEIVGGWGCTAPDEVGNMRTFHASDVVFPGFKPMRGLLLRMPGRVESPTLRQIRIIDLGPVGRDQLLELVSMAEESLTHSKGLSLRRLKVTNCSCGPSFKWEHCRERAEKTLRDAIPQLNFEVANRFCDCRRRSDPNDPNSTFVVEETELVRVSTAVVAKVGDWNIGGDGNWGLTTMARGGSAWNAVGGTRNNSKVAKQLRSIFGPHLIWLGPLH